MDTFLSLTSDGAILEKYIRNGNMFKFKIKYLAMVNDDAHINLIDSVIKLLNIYNPNMIDFVINNLPMKTCFCSGYGPYSDCILHLMIKEKISIRHIKTLCRKTHHIVTTECTSTRIVFSSRLDVLKFILKEYPIHDNWIVFLIRECVRRGNINIHKYLISQGLSMTHIIKNPEVFLCEMNTSRDNVIKEYIFLLRDMYGLRMELPVLLNCVKGSAYIRYSNHAILSVFTQMIMNSGIYINKNSVLYYIVHSRERTFVTLRKYIKHLPYSEKYIMHGVDKHIVAISEIIDTCDNGIDEPMCPQCLQPIRLSTRIIYINKFFGGITTSTHEIHKINLQDMFVLAGQMSGYSSTLKN